MIKKKNYNYLFILLFFIFIALVVIFSSSNSNDILLGDISGIPGDANNDGSISSLDYIKIKKHILGIQLLTGDNFSRADISNDGKITSLDYIAVRKIILGLTPKPTARPTNVATAIPKPTTTPTAAPSTMTTPTPGPTVARSTITKKTSYVKEFDITHYWGIYAEYIDDTQAQYLRDAGFTLVWVRGDKANSTYTRQKYAEIMGKALDNVNKYGLKALVEGWYIPVHYGDSSETQTTRRNYLLDTINDLSKYPNVVEYFIADEPPDSSYYSALADLVDLVHQKDPGADGFINLLPKGITSENYRDVYLTKFASTVKSYTLSFDRYIFGTDGSVDKKNYYSNLQDIYDIATKYNKIPSSILLLTQHMGYKNLTRNDIAFQMSVSLAFGMKRISYFTYSIDGLVGRSENFKNAMVDELHRRTDHYYDVQSVNKWGLSLGRELFNKKNSGIFGFSEGSLTSYGSSSITASKAGIISMFNDKSYMLVNTEIVNPSDNTFTFSSLKGISFYETNSNSWVSITGDTSNDNFEINYSKNQIIIKPGRCILLKGGSYWKGSTSENWKQDGSGWHYYDSNGNLVKDKFIKYENEWYYLNSNGVMATEWQKVSNNWYYFDSNGIMQTGWKEISNKWYYFNSEGIMQTGWVSFSGSYYYFNSDGVMQTGWIKDDGKYYYLDSKGVMQTGWLKDNNNYYYLNGSGVMLTGWQSISSTWYYFDTSGKMQTGWVTTNGKWYYLNSSGAMQTGWLKDNNKWYYLDSDGVMLTGWQKLTGGGALHWYYFDDKGVMVSNTTKTIDNTSYTFNADGVCTTSPGCDV